MIRVKLPNITFTGVGMPKLELDPVIVTGTLAVYDFGNTASYAGGNPATGASVTNLVSAGAAGTITEGTDGIVASGGGLQWTSAGNYLSAGSAVRDALWNSGTGKNWAIAVWCKFGSTPANNTIIARWASSNFSTSPRLFHLYGSTSGTNRVALTTRGFSQINSSATPGSVVQFAFGVVGNTLELYRNAVLDSSLAGTATWDASLNASSIRMGIDTTGGLATQADLVTYRLVIENLTASGRSVAAFAAADYAAANGRFS